MITIEIDETTSRELNEYFRNVDPPARGYVAKQLIIYAISIAPNAHVSPFLSFAQPQPKKQQEVPEPKFDHFEKMKPKQEFKQAERGERKIVALTEEERLAAAEKKLGSF